jgi:hypothetical protein
LLEQRVVLAVLKCAFPFANVSLDDAVVVAVVLKDVYPGCLLAGIYGIIARAVRLEILIEVDPGREAEPALWD